VNDGDDQDPYSCLCAKAHEDVLPVAPGRHAHGLLVGTRVVREAGGKFSVTLTKLMTATAMSRVLSLAPDAVRSPSITLPLVGNKVRELVLQVHAGGGGVAPIMHLAAPVYSIHWVTMSKKSAEASITLEHQRIAAS